MSEEAKYDSWRIELPWIPVSLNVYLRQHWRERDKLLQDVGFIIKPYLRVVLDDLAIRGPLPWKAEMTFEVYAKAVRDDDNCVVARKICLDAMRKLNFLSQDSPEWVRSTDLPCQVDRKRPRLVITIRKFEVNIDAPKA